MPLLVSIILPTYNHSNYILQTLDGINLQETSFKIKVIIGNDCSTDDTELVCNNYVFTNENIVLHHFKNTLNVGVIQNWKNILQFADTKYLAVCEGDDYWTDKYKLAKQIEILESNPNISICFHAATYFNDKSNEIIKHHGFGGPQITNITNLAFCNYIDNLTVVCRNNALQNPYPEWVFNNSYLVPDYAWHLYNAQFGDIFFINKNMANYRVRENALWSTKENGYRNQHLLETLLPALKKNINDKTVQLQIDLQALTISENDITSENIETTLKFIDKQSIIYFYKEKLKIANSFTEKLEKSTSYKFGNWIVKSLAFLKKN